MNARARGPMKFLGVVITALALVIALHIGSGFATFHHGNGRSAASVGLVSAHFFVPGTGNPGETGSAHPGDEAVIAYPATQPVTSDYAGSVQAGVNGLNQAVDAAPPGTSVSVGGFSQGAQVANQWAAQPGATDGREVTLETSGSPCVPVTGILIRWDIARAVAGNCSPLPPNVSQVMTVQACDPIANFPERLDLLTGLNGLAGYTYCHTYGYGPDQLNRPDIYTYQDGNITYRVIPAGPTSPLVRALHDNGVFLPGDVEAGINTAVSQSGPGPKGGPVPAETSAVHPVAASMNTPPPTPVPDVLTQAGQAVGQGLQNAATTFADQVEGFVSDAAAVVTPPQDAPPSPPEPVFTGNVAAVAGIADQYIPAPDVDRIAAQVQASPLGAALNSLPPLPFG